MTGRRSRHRLIGRSPRLEIRKPAQHCRLQKPEVRDRGSEFPKATLSAGYLLVEKILVMAVECFPGQIFIRAVPKGDRGPRQEIVHPSSETRLFSLRGGQGCFVQGNYNGHLSAWGETITLTDDHALDAGGIGHITIRVFFNDDFHTMNMGANPNFAS